MNIDAQVWQRPDVATYYLQGVRGGIPFAAEQIDIMLRVIAGLRPNGIQRFLDLGCGDGILGAQLLARYPQAQGLFIDFSAVMLEAGREKLAPFETETTFLELDYSDPNWVNHLIVQAQVPFDVIVSGFSIHHQPDPRKQEIYREIYDLLRPNGLFLNLEHVSSPTAELETIWNEQMIDAMYHNQAGTATSKSRDTIAYECLTTPDKAANILCDVETQCRWLRQIGFKQVDCYFKCFELALFGGQKPSLTKR